MADGKANDAPQRLTEVVTRMNEPIDRLRGLAEMALSIASSGELPTIEAGDDDDQRTPLQHASAELAFHRIVQDQIGPDFAGAPAWLLLVDLFSHQSIGKPISVSSACIASGAPPTTALRWIQTMVRRGMIERYPDVHDARRIYLKLTPEMFETMGRLIVRRG